MAMTKCKDCGNQVSKSAKACPQCGAPVPKGTSVFTWIVAGVFGFWLFGAMMAPDSPRSAAASPKAAPAVASGPMLELQSWRCEKEHTYMHVRGEVKNITSSPMKNVKVVATFRTKGGDLVKSESALLDYNPIMPGQSSPFHALGSDNPAATKCEIDFTTFGGQSISYRSK